MAGHILHVREQVTPLQINKKHQKCLLAVNPIQNVVFYQGETIWFSSPVNKTVTSINCDPWNATCLRNLSNVVLFSTFLQQLNS